MMHVLLLSRYETFNNLAGPFIQNDLQIEKKILPVYHKENNLCAPLPAEIRVHRAAIRKSATVIG